MSPMFLYVEKSPSTPTTLSSFASHDRVVDTGKVAFFDTLKLSTDTAPLKELFSSLESTYNFPRITAVSKELFSNSTQTTSPTL